MFSIVIGVCFCLGEGGEGRLVFFYMLFFVVLCIIRMLVWCIEFKLGYKLGYNKCLEYKS